MGESERKIEELKGGRDSFETRHEENKEGDKKITKKKKKKKS